MTPDERRQFIDALIEGEITDADFLRLEAELSVDAPARREYYERLALSVQLEVEAGAIALAAAPENEVATLAPPSVRRWRRAFVGMSAAAAILLAAVGWLLRSTRPGPGDAPSILASSPARPEEQAAGYAVIAGQNGAVWKGTPPMADGALVPQGPLHLAAGLVQLELFSGVTVVVEGEAEFTLISPMEMAVAHGKVRAHVPEPAHGFRLRTAEGEVVDLGTDFAVNVSAGQSEVHVLSGEVEWHSSQRNIRRMEGGEAGRWSSGGEVVDLRTDAEEFVGPEELREEIDAARHAKREAWQEGAESLRRDPRLVAFYQMGEVDGGSRRLPNRAIEAGAVGGDGAIVAAVPATDRWGQPEGALDFSPTGSRVRVTIPGEYRSLTLTCWARIHSLDRWYNSLFLTDGHDLHEPHWQIMDDGRLFFSVKKRDTFDRINGEKDKHVYYSPPFWKASLSGQWLMIATVYDVDARTVTHYLNGEPLGRETIPEEYLVEQVRIGKASIGNWGDPIRADPHFAVRNLNGSINEFALFGAALPAGEIKELYEHGKP